MKPIICAAASFRGATEGGEPGIHSPRAVVMDSGLAASRRPGMTLRMIRISKRSTRALGSASASRALGSASTSEFLFRRRPADEVADPRENDDRCGGHLDDETSHQCTGVI